MNAPTASATPAPLHFLHIGKAAGTQIGRLAKTINASQSAWQIIKHPHRTDLKDLPRKEAFFFSVRDPISRFKSGFYSRKRKGQPRIFVEWTYHERLAFEAFDHANDLAEALFEDGPRGQQAMAAILSINHTGKDQGDWFYRRGFFLDQERLKGIIRQEHFDADWALFCRRIGVTAPAPEADPTRQHRNDYTDIPPLSDLARANLARWYVQDIEFYRRCADWVTAHA